MAGFRLGWKIAIALAAAALSVTMAQAQNWPSRPVKVIMATAAGSAPDVIARIVTDRLSQLWGQQVLILNRPGAGGLIALQALASAERDGHTLYMPSSSSLVVLPVTNANLPLSIERDLVPIGLLGEQPFAIVAGSSLGISTLPEFIALARRKPGELTYAANFRGSLPNMTAEWFSDRAGISMTFCALSRRAAGPAGRDGRTGVRDGRGARGVHQLDGVEIGQTARDHLAKTAAELS
jgi:tripartite-type tricarboxylate transporter receptor subunit TctC